MNQASRLGVGIIGSGRVGPVLGRSLAGAGHAIVGVTAAGEENRERVASMLPGVPVLDTRELVRRSELVLIAIPGEEIPGLVKGLADLRAWQAGQLVIHTAPEHGYGVFEPALESGVIPLALHPAIRFTGTSLDLGRLAGATVAVTAPPAVLPIGEALAVEMGGEPITVSEQDRVAYAETVRAAHERSDAAVREAVAALESMSVERPAALVGGVVRSSIDDALRALDP